MGEAAAAAFAGQHWKRRVTAHQHLQEPGNLLRSSSEVARVALAGRGGPSSGCGLDGNPGSSTDRSNSRSS
ncbi:unnamed protein product [Spirodela intermedia]|uniref:Uncharacterized protein n=1 Tax=Spirodela intermedia TaxID=51605 RepID=A0A7I8LN05_SPIIN|nr:unnamed protein product [Spirodela intermedia]